MFSFKPNEKIDKKEYLFGRNKQFQQLETLLNNIHRGTNCQLQGERRFGKTSILNCAVTELKQKNKGNFLPYYFDFKKGYIYKGTANVYRRIIGKIIVDLTISGFFESSKLIRNKEIKPFTVFEDAFEYLKKIEDYRIQGIFEDFILDFSHSFDASFVFLIDEYEYLITKSLDSPEGFVPIRNISENPRDKTYKPLTYILSGTKSWNVLCTQIGSPELNNQGSSIIYVGAIEKENFYEMLDFYYKDFEQINQYPELEKTILYMLTGGIPYYAKKLGESLISGGKRNATYDMLATDFDSIVRNLDDFEKKIIAKILKNNKLIEKNILFNLIDRGIIRQENKKHKINGKLLEDYFKYSKASEVIFATDAFLVDPITAEVDTICERIEGINRNYVNIIKGTHLFEPTIHEHSQRMSLQKKSENADSFKSFVNTIYVIVHERTADKSRGPKFRIPTNLRDHIFIKRINSLRQEYHHLTNSSAYQKRPSQFTRAQLFKHYLKSEKEPVENDYPDFHLSVLRDFNEFLGDLLQEITQ